MITAMTGTTTPVLAQTFEQEDQPSQDQAAQTDNSRVSSAQVAPRENPPRAQTLDPRTTDPDALFKEIFGKDRPQLRPDNYAILVDGVNVGDFFLDLANDGSGFVDSRLVSKVLIPIAEEAMVVRLSALPEGERVSFEELRKAGLTVEFDRFRLVLRIGFPVEFRLARDLSLRRARRRADIEYAEQADFSAFASARAGVDLVQSSDVDPNGFSGLASVFDFGMNIGGIAAQGRLRYNERRTNKWSRGDFRLTYDDTERLIRYEAGDLSVGRRPFQLAPRIAGISAFREFPINPYLNIRPQSEQGFALDQPARVEVLLNGVPLRTFDLPAGRFNLRELPLIPSAANDLQLRITYATGETEILAYPAFYDIELLEPGLFDFAFNVGMPFVDDDRGRVYDDGDYNVIGFARIGLSQVLTVGVNWEGNKSFNTVGTEVIWASPIGSFQINASVNANDPSLNSGRLSARYAWRGSDTERGRAIDAQITLTGRDYQTLNQVFGGNLTKLTANIRAGQVIGSRTRAQVFASYEDLRGFGQTTVAGATISQGYNWGTVAIGGEYRWTQMGNDATIRASFTIPLGRRGTISGNYVSERNAATIDFNRPPAIGVGSLGYSAAIERRDGFDRQRAQVTYLGNRFEGALIQNRQSGSGRDDVRAGFTFGSAISMADGTFALSRPITNSFAIFAVDAGAADYRIAVEPRTGFGSTETRFTAKSGTLGPAVVPNLPAYFDRTIEVVAPDAPVGTSVGSQVFSIKPGFLSGFRLKVGGANNVTFLGVLVDSLGNPAGLVSGKARLVNGDGSEETVAFFTNGSGRFLLEGLREASNYSLIIDGSDGTASATVTVPEGTVGLYRVETPIQLNAPLADPPAPETDGEE